ncbi:MAG: PKD domain-containing protein [Ilumatobacteraceae bacterium]
MSPQTFSPNGDGYDDSTQIRFCLDNAANVTATVTDSNDGQVRTFAYQASYPSGCQYVTWDGHDDGGSVVADGTYDIKLTALNASGTPTSVTKEVVVDRRLPGTLTAPSPGDNLAGTAQFVFTPTAGVNVTQVYFSVVAPGGSCGSDWITSPDGNGRFVWSTDTTSCGDGAGQVTAVAYWTDGFGQQHYFSTPQLAVTLSNPQAPSTSVVYVSPQTFSPNGDGQEDSTGIAYCVNDTGDPSQTEHVLVRILDSDNNVVRTLVDEDQNPTASSACSPWFGGYRSTVWDGLDNDAKPVADGAYTVSVQATDATNLTGSSTSPVVVDTRIPGTLTTPSAGDTLAGTQQFVFTPTAGVNVTQIYLGLSAQSHSESFGIYNPSTDGKWRTTLPVGAFPQGPADLYWTAYWTDGFGQQHSYSGHFQVAIDPTAVPLVVAPTTTTGDAPFDATLTVTTSDPNSQPLTLYIDWGDGSSPSSQQLTAPYDPIVLTHHYDKPGNFSAFVSVSNGQGGYAAQTTPIVANGKPNTPPTVSVTNTPTSGTAPLDTGFTIAATDPDGDALSYKIDFGDGSSVVQGVVSAIPIHHVYTAPGTYTARTEVTDGKVGVVRTARITVALSEPLKANAGDDLTGVTNSSVSFDGTASVPRAAISSYSWDFGDGSTGAGSTIGHVYTAPGTYTATLTVRSGAQTSTDTTKVVIATPPPAEGLFVTVKGGGQPLAGATVVVIKPDGTRTSAATAGDGVATLHGLADGTVTAYVWDDGYQPQAVTGTVASGHGEVTVDLASGDVASATLETHVMTVNEIKDAGIDVSDPENSHVYEATINLYFVPDTPDAPPPPPIQIAVDGPTVYCLSNCGGGGGGGGGGGFPVTEGVPVSGGDAQAYPTVTYVQGQPIIQWLVLPIRASWLKEFFDVKMVVQNLTTGLTFEHGAATLALPGGLTLAPTASGQSLTQDLPDIAAGSSATADWIVRGDTEGSYDLSAEYTGSVEPLGQSLHIVAQTKNQLHVWGASALQASIIVDCKAARWAPYNVEVQIKNVADTNVYNLLVEMLDRPADQPDTDAQFFYAPMPPQTQGIGDLKPGSTFTADYTVFAGLGNDEVQKLKLVLENSFIAQTGGDVDLHPTLDCADNPYTGQNAGPVNVTIQNAGGVDNAHLTWFAPAAPDGLTVTGYQVWTRQQLRTGPWSPYKTDSHRVDGQESLDIPSSKRVLGRYYAVGTEFSDGSVRFLHQIGVGPSRYAALGDSYSSGEGVPAFEPGTATDYSPVPDDEKEQYPYDNKCHRSAEGSYSRLLVADNSVNANLEPSTFAACSGAVTNDVFEPNPDNAGEPPQQSAGAKSQTDIGQVNRFTDLITLTMGGNDINFPSIVLGCIISDCSKRINDAIGGPAYFDQLAKMYKPSGPFASDDAPVFDAGGNCSTPGLTPNQQAFCMAIASEGDGGTDPSDPASVNPTYVSDSSGVLHQRLLKVYLALGRKAPNAHIVVLDYPTVITDDADGTCDLGLNLGPFSANLDASERRSISYLLAQLNKVIHRAVTDAKAQLASEGLPATIDDVDPAAEFAGHGLCDGGHINGPGPTGSYFNTVVLPILASEGNNGPTAFTAHPNAYGQQAFERALAPKVNSVLATALPQSVTPVDTVNVSPNAATLHVASTWPGSTVSLRLTGPHGETYDANSTGVTTGRDATSQWIEVPNPEQGRWSVAVFGDDVAPDGEPVQVTSYATAATPTSPVSHIETQVAGVDGRTFALDASGSSSSQGSLSYRWIYSDGSSASGPQVTHTFTNDGELWASLQLDDGVSIPTTDSVVLGQASAGPVFSQSTPTATAAVGVPYAFTFDVAGSPTPTLALADGTLPDGLSLSSSGILAGTPTRAGSFTFSVRATNDAGSATAGPFTISVNEPPRLTSGTPPSGTLGVPYAFTFTATGSPAPTFRVASGRLSDGLSLSPTGLLSGTPSASGTFSFAIEASNPAGNADTPTLTLTIGAPGSLKISTTALPSGKVGSQYSATLVATGGKLPYHWSIAGGALPSGITLNGTTGQLAGTPKTPGLYKITVQLVDSATPKAKKLKTKLRLQVAPAAITISPATLPGATRGTKYLAALTAGGGSTPYKFRIGGGTLPAGLKLTAKGSLQGKPTQQGSFSFTIVATDKYGYAGSRTYALRVA